MPVTLVNAYNVVASLLQHAACFHSEKARVTKMWKCGSAKVLKLTLTLTLTLTLPLPQDP